MALSSAIDYSRARPRHRKAPVLTREEEYELAVRAKAGDKRAQDRLVTSNLGLVWKIAKSFTRYGIPLEDLAQEGTLGLINALERYDPERGYKFITYASWWVRAYLFDFVKTMRGVVCIPTSGSTSTAFFRVRALRIELERNGEKITNQQLAERLGISLDILEHVSFWFDQAPLSIDMPAGRRTNGNVAVLLRDTLVDRGDSPEDNAVADDEADRRSAAVADALQRLPPRERMIVERCVMATATDEKETLQVIATELGCSRERVRQLKVSGISKLQRILWDRRYELWRTF